MSLESVRSFVLGTFEANVKFKVLSIGKRMVIVQKGRLFLKKYLFLLACVKESKNQTCSGVHSHF